MQCSKQAILHVVLPGYLRLEVNNARDEAAFNRENLGSQSSLVQNTACMGGDLQLGGGASFTHEGLVHRFH